MYIKQPCPELILPQVAPARSSLLQRQFHLCETATANNYDFQVVFNASQLYCAVESI